MFVSVFAACKGAGIMFDLAFLINENGWCHNLEIFFSTPVERNLTKSGLL